MRLIGITGGVGAGKSEVLDWLHAHYRCYILKSDQAANQIKEPGEICYEPLVSLLGSEVLTGDGRIDKGKMAAKIFADTELLQKVNAIIHPAVKAYILQKIEELRAEKSVDYFFLEAALLIEEGYDKIVDELWYIRADESVRRMRLKQARGYSDEKIDQILQAQLSDEAFQEHCDFVIDNSHQMEETYRQIKEKLGDT